MLEIIWKACPGIVLLALAEVVLGSTHSFLFNTYLYQYALNALQAGKELRSILITLIAMFAFSLLYQVCQVGKKCYFELNTPKVEAYIQNMLQKKAAEVDLACFENPAFYDTYVKATEEAAERAFKVLTNAMDVVWVFVYVSAVGRIVFTIDPIFIVFALMPVICTILIGKKRNRDQYAYQMRKKEMARQRDYVRRTFYLNDYAKEMRLTNMWKVMAQRMHESVEEMKGIVRQYGYRLMFYEYLFDFMFDIVVYMGACVLAAFKTLVLKNMLIGDCFVVFNAITNLAGTLEYMGSMVFKLDENSLYVDNLRDFLEYEVKISENENAPEVPVMKKLELRNLSFAYEGQENPVLHNVSFTIRAGEKVAIVGHNGAGKTTLIKLLQRLYDPTEGEVLLNDENIKKFRLSSYRNLFGSVFQDYRLFAVSVAENVLLRGDITDADRENVKEALIRSDSYEKVESLSRQMDTTVTKEFDSEGAVFSGGEAQKISIARVFAGNSEIVIMDEPTSALDPIAEQKMYHNMFEACEGKTVIFISHRMSSAAMADRIYLFENGEIVEEGTHRELLQQNAKYAQMWHKQADTYINDCREVNA